VIASDPNARRDKEASVAMPLLSRFIFAAAVLVVVLAKAVAARLIHALRQQCRRGLIDGTDIADATSLIIDRCQQLCNMYPPAGGIPWTLLCRLEAPAWRSSSRRVLFCERGWDKPERSRSRLQFDITIPHEALSHFLIDTDSPVLMLNTEKAEAV
jgi:hypothetical protein